MSGFMYLVFVVTLIAFIVFWRKKSAARKLAGDNYKEDPTYIDISKKKRLIGIVCVVALILGVATSGGDNNKSSSNNSPKQVTQKESTQKAPEKTPEEIAAEKAAKEQEDARKAEEKKANDISEGWDKSNQKDEDGKNMKKAIDLIKAYPDYIPSAQAEALNTNSAIKKPWDFYGKVLSVSSMIYDIQHFPPDSNIAKYLKQDGFEAMLRTADGKYISILVVGSGDGIENNTQVTLKGYLIGLTTLENKRGGGHSDGLKFVLQQ